MMKKGKKFILCLATLLVCLFGLGTVKAEEPFDNTSYYNGRVKVEIISTYDKTKGKYGQITYKYKFTNNTDQRLYLFDDMLKSSLGDLANDLGDGRYVDPGACLTVTVVYDLPELKDVINNIDACFQIQQEGGHFLVVECGKGTDKVEVEEPKPTPEEPKTPEKPKPTPAPKKETPQVVKVPATAAEASLIFISVGVGVVAIAATTLYVIVKDNKSKDKVK